MSQTQKRHANRLILPDRIFHALNLLVLLVAGVIVLFPLL